MRALRLSVGMFTILHVDVGTPDRRMLRWAVLLAPLVGAVLGSLAAAVMGAAGFVADWRSGPDQPLSTLLAAVLGIVTLAVLTGGLHLDGLADSADGLAARADQERTLTIMRDSAVGAMGALAIAAAVLVDVVALSVSVEHGRGTQALVTAVVAGRVAIVWACTRQAARPDGLGAWVSQVVSWRAALVVTVLSLAVPALLPASQGDLFGRLGSVATLPLGVAVALLVWQPLTRRVGGVTGDILGAVAQTATAVALIATALLG